MDKLVNGWIRHQRLSARQEESHRPTCACAEGFDVTDASLDDFKTHVRRDPDNHPNLEADAEIEAYYKDLISNVNTNERKNDTFPTNEPTTPVTPSKKRPIPVTHDGADTSLNTVGGQAGGLERAASGACRSNKKICSPPSSVDQQRGSDLSTTVRSRARPQNHDADFQRREPGNPAGRLWSPTDRSPPRASQAKARRQPTSANNRHNTSLSGKSNRDPPRWQGNEGGLGDSKENVMIKEPEIRPISQQQLVPEVKGIYTGLVMVESKCIEVDNAQSANKDKENQLTNEQWQALIALHRTLLHEHHDFFLASQHPSASSALRRLSHKYAMPARMWRHGIHSFLELLRHRLPESLEHMLSFIYLAYSIMALLYETIPAFEDTWIECLGDLARYRMAIEDDDIRDREVWTGVARHWYTQASDKNPTTGRLYHHLAILARPNALQQLYFYSKSLCVPIPFASARESIMTLFDPILGSTAARLQPIVAAFVRIHGVLIAEKNTELLEPSLETFYGTLDGYIAKSSKFWLESGYHIGIANGCLLLEYGEKSNVLTSVILQDEQPAATTTDSPAPETEPSDTFRQAVAFSNQTYEIIVKRWGDMNTLPYLHTTLVFMLYMSAFPAAMRHLENEFPWKLTAVTLNLLIKTCNAKLRMDSTDFPKQHDGEATNPLPEDYAMRGIYFAEKFFPKDWFTNDRTEEDERYLELPSMTELRKERILWIGRMIARAGKWLTWDEKSMEFGVPAEYDFDLDEITMTNVEDSPVPPLPTHIVPQFDDEIGQ